MSCCLTALRKTNENNIRLSDESETTQEDIALKILIAGDGKVGATLTRQLSSAGYDITLIDSKENVLETSIERYDVLAIKGNCASMSVLMQAGVKEADLLIAATSADEINLLCCMTAHKLNPKIHTISRIRNPEYTDQIYQMRDYFALSLIVNPELQAAREMEHLLKYPGFLRRDTFAKGRVEIVELKVKPGSKLCDLALTDLYNIVNCKVLVCIVKRNGDVVAPDGNFVLREGDKIYVTAQSNNLTLLLKNLGVITHRVKRVIICGGGRVSYYLAQILQRSGITVQIIEKDKDKCIQLAGQLPNATVIHGDASDQQLLESEGIDKCDAIITMTGLDELNMVISLYANSIGVPQVITKLGHNDANRLLDTLDIGSAICPKDLCASTIVRYVRAIRNQTGAALSVHSIADGLVEAIEFKVDESTRHRDTPLKDIHLRRHILIVCITHRFRPSIPDGNSMFTSGDTVIIISTGDKVIYQLNDIFE